MHTISPEYWLRKKVHFTVRSYVVSVCHPHNKRLSSGLACVYEREATIGSTRREGEISKATDGGGMIKGGSNEWNRFVGSVRYGYSQ